MRDGRSLGVVVDHGQLIIVDEYLVCRGTQAKNDLAPEEIQKWILNQGYLNVA